MRLYLEIFADSDRFSPDPRLELQRIVHSVADRIGTADEAKPMQLRDADGIVAGHMVITDQDRQGGNRGRTQTRR